MRRRSLLASALLLPTTLPGIGRAQTSDPGRAIRLIVPTPPGGSSDACARLLTQALSRVLGQGFVVDNKPGAGGALAAQALMAAAPDGQTLMWTLASMSGLPVLQKASPYQALTDLSPVSLVGSFTYAMFVHPGVPGRSVAEFVDHARAHPGQISYATGSLGDYMATTRFLKATGVNSVRVPYRGGSQLMPDLAAGRVQLNFGPLSSGLPLVREGKLRLLAVLQPQRSALAPDTPTLAEAGVQGVSLPTWQALFGPPRMPAAQALRVSRAVAQVLTEPELRGQLEQQALAVEGSTPQLLAAAAEQGGQLWRSFVAEHEIAPE